MRVSKTSSILSLLLVAALAIVTVNTYFAFRAIQTLQQSQVWVTHTWQVIHSVDQIISALHNAESTNRDYLLTSGQQGLEDYQAARDTLPSQLANFGVLTSDNPRQQKRLATVRQLIGDRIALLDRCVQLQQTGHAAAAHSLIATGNGQAVMDQVVALTGQAQREEWDLLSSRTVTANTNARRARWAVLFASGLDMLLLVLMWRYIQRERALRLTADRTATQLSKLQNLSDIALSQLTLKELTSQLLTTVKRLIGAESAALGLLHNENLLVTAEEGTRVKTGAEIDISGAPLLKEAIAAKQPVRIEVEDIAQHHAGDLLHAGTSSILVSPLLRDNQVSALLIAGKRTAGKFTADDEQLLSITADRIALAIDRSQAYENERAARQLAEESAAEVQLLNDILEQRVQQRTAELEITNKELEAFSYSVSHDLRAPLRTIDGFSLALEEDYASVIDSTGKNYIKRVRAGVQRMGTLIDSLLQLSRITRAELAREQIDLSAMAQGIADESLQQTKDRIIHFNIEPNLFADADPHLLRAALENLLGNAVKFTSKKQEATISFGWSPEQQAYYVRDTGAGFDPQYAGKLFHAFNRLHGDKDFTGSGIGLASVARVIGRHQGRIWAEGQVDHGATFWFTLGEEQAVRAPA